MGIGSGPGEPSLTLAHLVPATHIICTDLQPVMNDKARARAEKMGLRNVDFKVVNAEDLSEFPDNKFTAVMMNYVLMFVPNRAKAISEVERVLKPGGRAYLSVWK